MITRKNKKIYIISIVLILLLITFVYRHNLIKFNKTPPFLSLAGFGIILPASGSSGQGGGCGDPEPDPYDERECPNGKKSVVISLGGTNSDGSFNNATGDAVKGCNSSTEIINGNFNHAKDAGEFAERKVKEIKEKDKKNGTCTEITIAAHSISATGVFNRNIPADNVILYDPPYDRGAPSIACNPLLTWIPAINDGCENKKAKDDGIGDSSCTVNKTNGNPSNPGHDNFDELGSEISGALGC
jgi:hypothetical protein